MAHSWLVLFFLNDFERDKVTVIQKSPLGSRKTMIHDTFNLKVNSLAPSMDGRSFFFSNAQPMLFRLPCFWMALAIAQINYLPRRSLSQNLKPVPGAVSLRGIIAQKAGNHSILNLKDIRQGFTFVEVLAQNQRHLLVLFQAGTTSRNLAGPP